MTLRDENKKDICAAENLIRQVKMYFLKYKEISLVYGKGLKHTHVHVLNLYSPNILLIEIQYLTSDTRFALFHRLGVSP